MRMFTAAFPLLGALAAIMAPTPTRAQDRAASAVPAPDWQRLFPGSNSPATLSWDRASVAREGDLVRLVVRAEASFGAGQPSHGDFLYEFRCPDSKFRVVRTTNYTPAGEPLVEDTPR